MNIALGKYAVFSTYAYFPICTSHINVCQWGGGVKMAKILRTYIMGAA